MGDGNPLDPETVALIRCLEEALLATWLPNICRPHGGCR